MGRALHAGESGTSHKPWVWTVLLVVVVFLYLNLFILPALPVFLAEDPQIYVVNAMRMLEGQAIYRDFFQFTTPGTELVCVALFKLFGPRTWVLNALLLVLGLALMWISVEISKTVLSGPAIVLPGLLFLTFAFRIWLIGSTHNWFSVLWSMAAVWVVIARRTPPRLVAAGALCGLASFFTQTRGVVVLAGLFAFLVWEHRQKAQSWRAFLHRRFQDGLQQGLCLLAGFAAAALGTNAYFVGKVGLRRFVNCTVVFPYRYFSADVTYNTLRAYTADLPDLLFSGSWIEHRLPGLAIWFFIHALLPFVYVIFLMRYRREARARPEEPWDRLMLLCAVGISLLVGIASAPSWFRLCSVSLPALIILVWMASSGSYAGSSSSPNSPNSQRRLAKFPTAFLWCGAILLVLAEPLERQFGEWARLDAPPGSMAILDQDLADKFRWILTRARPGEFFFRGIYPDYYFPLGLRNPAQAPYVTATDFTRPEQVQNVVDTLEKYRVRFVLWSVWLDVPDTNRPEGDHLGPLRAYLRDHYHVVKIFPDADYEQVWERNDADSRSLALLVRPAGRSLGDSTSP